MYCSECYKPAAPAAVEFLLCHYVSEPSRLEAITIRLEHQASTFKGPKIAIAHFPLQRILRCRHLDLGLVSAAFGEVPHILAQARHWDIADCDGCA